MTIGFDLDRVFINTPPFVPGKIISQLYKKKDNGELLYRIPTRPEQVFRRLTHHSLLRPPIRENLAFLKELAEKNHSLYLISSRYSFLEKPTQELINKYHLKSMFKELYFNTNNQQPHLFKNAILKKLHLDIYVDDDLSLLQFVAKDNPKTIFYWLITDGDERSRQKHPVLEKNVLPIRQLSSIVK